MRRQFLLICATMMALCSFAQVWKSVPSNTLKTQSAVQNRRATITPTGDQIWWGYFNESDFSTYDELVGTGSVMPFLTGISIPANHEQIGNGTVQAVRIYLADGIPSTINDLKVWISKTLPTTLDAADYVQTLSGPFTSGANDFELTIPYDINNEAFYIGYYISSSTAYCVRTGGADKKDAFWISSPGNMGWEDLYGYGLGKLAFQILVSGATLDDNSVAVTNTDLGTAYGQMDSSAEVFLSVSNEGANALSSFDYTITSDDIVSDAVRITLPTPLTFGEAVTIKVSVPTEAVQGFKKKTITVTKVNGETNTNSNNKAEVTICSLSEIINRNVVVEELTGTGCGWCPRGLVGMEKLRKTFGDRFIGVGIHQYNSTDAMYIANYAPIDFSGAPSCYINRGAEIDPYYGSYSDVREDFYAEMQIPGLASVEVNGMFDEEFTKVNATANAKPLFEGTYSLEFALVADGLTGTGSAWNQSNYYYQYSAAQLPEDLSIFGSGGKYGSASITGWKFNDVAIASSYVSGTNQVAKQTLDEGVSGDFEYTLNLPTKATLKNALQKEQIYVVAILLDSNGNVVNAAKKKVDNYTPTAIQSVSNLTDGETVRYTLDGRQISAPQHGINIVRMSDGSVRKVMVK